MDSRSVGILVVVLGLVVVGVGLAVFAGLLGWFGHLPGDVRIESRSIRVYAPIVSMLLLSLAVTVIVNLVRRL